MNASVFFLFNLILKLKLIIHFVLLLKFHLKTNLLHFGYGNVSNFVGNNGAGVVKNVCKIVLNEVQHFFFQMQPLQHKQC